MSVHAAAIDTQMQLNRVVGCRFSYCGKYDFSKCIFVHPSGIDCGSDTSYTNTHTHTETQSSEWGGLKSTQKIAAKQTFHSHYGQATFECNARADSTHCSIRCVLCCICSGCVQSSKQTDTSMKNGKKMRWTVCDDNEMRQNEIAV